MFVDLNIKEAQIRPAGSKCKDYLKIAQKASGVNGADRRAKSINFLGKK